MLSCLITFSQETYFVTSPELLAMGRGGGKLALISTASLSKKRDGDLGTPIQWLPAPKYCLLGGKGRWRETRCFSEPFPGTSSQPLFSTGVCGTKCRWRSFGVLSLASAGLLHCKYHIIAIWVFALDRTHISCTILVYYSLSYIWALEPNTVSVFH